MNYECLIAFKLQVRGKIMKIMLLVIATLMASTAFACWEDIPLDEVIQNSDVVIIGEITSINVAEPPKQAEQYQYDIAQITVQKVILNTLKNKVIEPNQKLPLSMPSINNKLHLSTDLRYRIGKKGIWILKFQNGKFWAKYPKDYQPMSSKEKIRQIVEEL